MAFFDYLAQEKLCPTSINITTEKDKLSDFFKLWGKSQEIEVNAKLISNTKKEKKVCFSLCPLLVSFYHLWVISFIKKTTSTKRIGLF